jgi:hypothetical protein
VVAEVEEEENIDQTNIKQNPITATAVIFTQNPRGLFA